jgi:hypothetical protein
MVRKEEEKKLPLLLLLLLLFSFSSLLSLSLLSFLLLLVVQVALCSLLFWPPKNADGTERYNDCDRVLECLQRALKIASVSNPNLFVEILDR